MVSGFVSFAQNFEDVMLWRALKHVEHGFYVDVGAYSPTEMSVTQAFYERGWRGINIEPHPAYHREFLTARPRDINLKVAVGNRTEDLAMYLVSDTGLSTLDASQAQERVREGRTVIAEQVHVDTLASIWAAHIAPDQPVHFLKVDVEGFEREVLLGNDWQSCRPWILVVEATLPMTTTPSHQAWEGILTESGYLFVYGDGLNRFYVASEHEDLAPMFAFPPNNFDEFIRASEFEAGERSVRAEMGLAAVYGSRSWRWTRPLRASGGLGRRLRAATAGEWSRAQPAIRERAVQFALRFFRLVRKNRTLRRRASFVLRLPGVHVIGHRLERASQRRGSTPWYVTSDLSPRAQDVHRQLNDPNVTGPKDGD